MQKHMQLNAIDLFSGAGGLSHGLIKAGINVVVALDSNKDACSTYKINHPNVKIMNDDISCIPDSTFIGFKKNKKINMVVGCPPCQGFSTLTFNKDDPRNMLVREFLRVISLISPEIVMLENVPGILKKGNILFGEILSFLSENNYHIDYKVVQVADYGISQSRRRLVLIASKKNKIQIPSQTHSQDGINGLKWVPVKKTINDTMHIDTTTFRSMEDNLNSISWHITRELSSINKKRMKYIKAGENRFNIPEELRPKCHKNTSKGYGNVYTRMDPDLPSPTITSGCTTISCGRFIHPYKDRTISIREAAMIQTFPINYKFVAKNMESICRLVGNAFPCDLAYILGTHIINTMRGH